MNTFESQAAQGDILFVLVGEIPDGYEKVENETGDHIVAHSETGHHHVVSANKMDWYVSDNDEFFSYAKVHERCEVVHMRSFDTHAPITLSPGIYKLVRPREYTSEGFRRVLD